MYSEVYRPEPEEKTGEYIPTEIQTGAMCILAMVAAVFVSNQDYLVGSLLNGILTYVLEWAGYFVLFFFLCFGSLSFSESFSKTEFFAKNTERRWLIITIVVVIALYFIPVTFLKTSRYCPVCGKETDGAYIVYEGKRYCLKDGSQLLYDEGEYNFYE